MGTSRRISLQRRFVLFLLLPVALLLLAVGSAVNITQRIQAAAEGGQVLVSEAVGERAGNGLKIERFFEARLKGFDKPARLSVVSACKEKS